MEDKEKKLPLAGFESLTCRKQDLVRRLAEVMITYNLYSSSPRYQPLAQPVLLMIAILLLSYITFLHPFPLVHSAKFLGPPSS